MNNIIKSIDYLLLKKKNDDNQHMWMIKGIEDIIMWNS